MMLGRGLLAAAAVAALDQLSKAAVLWHFGESGCRRHSETVTGFFDLILTCNRGVSFGLLNRGAAISALVFAAAALAIVAVLVYWLCRVQRAVLAIAIGLVIGGAIGNVVDRLRFGAVVDFLCFHAGSWYWPAFNLADSAISVGVAAMLLDSLLLRGGEQQAKGRGDLLP